MELTEYRARMKDNYQFRTIGVEPRWVPGAGDIDGFIHDEVVRQFHDPRIEADGGRRVRWMRAAWDFALTQSAFGNLPDMDDILRLGKTIEPGMNAVTGFRLVNVYIGGSIGAPPGLLNEMVVALVQQVDKVRPEQGRIGPHPEEYRALWTRGGDEFGDVAKAYATKVKQVETADDWYLAFEAIHPFGDGNGRSGKVLHNWLLGTLNEPVLVADYFGGGNP